MGFLRTQYDKARGNVFLLPDALAEVVEERVLICGAEARGDQGTRQRAAQRRGARPPSQVLLAEMSEDLREQGLQVVAADVVHQIADLLPAHGRLGEGVRGRGIGRGRATRRNQQKAAFGERMERVLAGR